MKSLKSKTFSLLRSSERLFKMDMIYLAKGGFWTTLSFIINTATSIVAMIAFGNLLSKETYGIYNYLLSLGASLSFLTFSGIGTAVMRAVARGYENVVPLALRLQLKYNLIAVSTVLAVAIYYGYKGNMVFAGSLAMLSLAYPIAEAFHMYVNILTGRKHFNTLTKITSITAIASTTATVITIFLTQNILILISVYATMSLLPNIIAYSIITNGLIRTTPEPEQLQEMERTAFHITATGIIGTAAKYIDKILLFQIAGPAALAVYGFAIAGPERLRSLMKGWGIIALPNLAKRSLGEIHYVVYRRIGFSVLIGALLSLAYFVFAPLLFKLFLPKYLDAIFYSQILSLGLIVAPVIIYIGSIFAGQNMLRATYALSTGSQIIRIVLFVVFGWLWQIWGLIFASLLSTLINAIYSVIVWEIETRRLIKKNEQPI